MILQIRSTPHTAWLAIATGVLVVGWPAPARADSATSNGSAPLTNLPRVHMDAARRVELHVNGLPIADVLRMLSEETRRNIVAGKEVTGDVTANLYDVTLDEALDAVLRMNGLGYVRKGDVYFVHTLAELQQLRAMEQAPVSKVVRLKYISAADARDMVSPLLTPAGKISITPTAAAAPTSAGAPAGGSGSSGGGNGGGMGSSKLSMTATLDNANSDLIIITDVPENLREIERLIAEIDTRPRQVLIEATILRATLNESNALGIDFTTVGGVDFQAVGSTSAAAQNIVTGNTPSDRLMDTTFTVREAFTQGVPNGGFTFGIVKNNVGVFIRALEEVTDTTVIANPKVLALNKQQGQVIVGRRDGYRVTTVTETASIQSVEFLETGTQLFFRPFILDDNHVRMEIHPEDSTGGLTATDLPFKQTTEVTTNIIVRDGHTILIGGLFREVTTAGRGQIPGLGSLPLAGILFRNSNDNTIREEVIILLTVHVVKGEPEEKEGEELAADVERIRIGARRGLLGIGRERLAQAHYRWALEHLAKGHASRALWDARMALHYSPRLVPARQLVEQLEGRRAWDEDGSAVRNVVESLIARERGVERPPLGRPAPPFHIPDTLQGAPGFDDGVVHRSDAGRALSAGGADRDDECRDGDDAADPPPGSGGVPPAAAAPRPERVDGAGQKGARP